MPKKTPLMTFALASRVHWVWADFPRRPRVF
jgi:hypothetical protein